MSKIANYLLSLILLDISIVLLKAPQSWLVLELRVCQSLNLETAINICWQNTFNNNFNFNQFQTFNSWDIWEELMELEKGIMEKTLLYIVLLVSTHMKTESQ